MAKKAKKAKWESEEDLKDRYVSGVETKTAVKYNAAKKDMPDNYNKGMEEVAKKLGVSYGGYMGDAYEKQIRKVDGDAVATAAVEKADKYIDGYKRAVKLKKE